MKRLKQTVLLLALLSTLPWMMAAISPPYGVIDFDAFGAVGDGTTDNSAILTAAVSSTGVLAVRFGPKTYAFGSNVAIPDGVRLIGAGRESTVLQMKTGWTGNVLSLGQNCVVSDLQVKGNDAASTIGIRPTSGKGNIRVENCTIRDFNIGANDQGVCDGLTFSGVWFDSCVTYGFQSANASTNLTFIACAATNCGTRGFEFQASPNGVTMVGCSSSGSSSGLNFSSASNATAIGGNYADGVTVPGTGRRGGFFGVVDGAGAINPAALDSKQMSYGAPLHDNAEPATGTWLAGELVVNYAPGTTGTTPWAWLTSTGGTAGSGAVFQPLYRGLASVVGTATWDPGSLATGASEGKDVTVSGATVGAVALAGHTSITSGMTLNAVVTSSTNVRVTLTNVNATNPTDLSSGTVTVRVLQ